MMNLTSTKQMILKIKFFIGCFLMIVVVVSGCSDTKKQLQRSSARPPVQVTHISSGVISDSVSLSATTFYASQSQIAAPISGYLTAVKVHQGDGIKKGQLLFNMQTQEARVLQSDTLSQLGESSIEASSNGTVTNVNYSVGDFVQKGGILAKMSSPANLYLKLFVPYEVASQINKRRSFTVQMPSGTRVSASYAKTLSQADTNSQSVVWLFKPHQSNLLPAGLTFQVNVPTTRHKNTHLLPKKAVLSNTTLDHFWVMRVAHDSIAVKVPVQKGIENNRQVEILSPQFSPDDNIIISGQYGLEDSTVVHIQNGSSKP